MKNTKHDIETLGNLAMQLIADYPLYAHTSGITYEEAILIASIFYPEPKEWAKIVDEL
jgi:hypothetical protein